jgi:hypothetical protein
MAVVERCARAATAAATRNEDNKCELVDSGLTATLVVEMKSLACDGKARMLPGGNFNGP